MTAILSNPLTGTHVLRCVHCGLTQRQVDRMFRCSECHELLEAVYPDWAIPDPEARMRLKHLWRERRLSNAPEDSSGVWRYREMLPRLDRENIVTMSEGNTPLLPLHGAARALDLPYLVAKHQGLNPTGSFKDTGISAAISMAKAEGFRSVCCASTGNTSASVAAYAARAGMKSIVLLPAGQITSGKLAQAIEYGATVLQLRTDFDGCLKLLDEVIRRFPVYLLNSINPYRLEGQKTVAFELLEQLDWQVPSHVIVPGGNLGNSSALGKGFLELHSLGLIDALPKVSVIQAAGANPLARAMRENDGKELTPVHAETKATAIRIGNPASWRKAVAVLHKTGGVCEDVAEDEIALAKSELGAEGIGCEPASAATLAGLKKLVKSGFVRSSDSVVLVLTGHMLKDTDYMLQSRALRDRGRLGVDSHGLDSPEVNLFEADAGVVVKALEQMDAGR